MIHGGSGTGYTYDRCRCDLCTEAHRARVARRRRERFELTAANGGVSPIDNHGTHSNYSNWGCRCRPCVDAHTRVCAALRERRRQQRVSVGGAA